jgi:hypothetical protein
MTPPSVVLSEPPAVLSKLPTASQVVADEHETLRRGTGVAAGRACTVHVAPPSVVLRVLSAPTATQILTSARKTTRRDLLTSYEGG